MLPAAVRRRPIERRHADPEAAGTADSALVRLRNVSVDMERTPVLRGLDFQVATGEAVGLAGANGSGKSTLLSVLATLRTPRKGDGWVLGARLGTSAVDAVRSRIGLVGHEPALYSQLTLAENLEFLTSLLARPPREALAALEEVGLAGAAQRRVEQCSQGMRRRADLARILLARPRLLLLDEVHAGLDPGAGEMVDELVTEACRRGGAAVVVSHERARLESLADRVVEIADGRAAVPPQGVGSR